MKLMQTHYFCICKAPCFIKLIGHIVKLLLSPGLQVYCFHAGPDILCKYMQHNHLRCVMMREVSLKT